MRVAADPAVTLVGISALLTPTMSAMEKTVAALNRSPRRKDFKIMVGGAPVSQSFCDSIGADVYTGDAASAADAALEICLAKHPA